jgi:hypothetical protein
MSLFNQRQREIYDRLENRFIRDNVFLSLDLIFAFSEQSGKRIGKNDLIVRQREILLLVS